MGIFFPGATLYRRKRELQTVLKHFIQRHVGRAWTTAGYGTGVRTNWWSSEKLTAYVNAQIAPGLDDLAEKTGPGVPAALAKILNGAQAARGISVGCGAAIKERRLLQAGLVGHFTLFDLSESRIALARQEAEAQGLADRIDARVEDAFAAAHESYDLVYWDHSLHHMMDVRHAVAWSVDRLRPGGLLLINEYLGPTRLQWTIAEVRRARAFLAGAQAQLSAPIRSLWYRSPLSRLRMMMRDPSEAPQSDRIMDACRASCDGFAPTPIGCAMIDICSPHLVPATTEEDAALYDLIAFDRQCAAEGFHHFAFGIWRKPG